MPGTTHAPPQATLEEEVAANGLLITTGLFIHEGDDVWRYDGDRPGPGWHAHGWFSKIIVVLVGGRPRVVTLRKRRWRLSGTNTTCHSRPADDLPFIRFSAMIIVLRVWAWLLSTVGLHNRQETLAGLSTGAGSDRSVQRWTARATRNALAVQQAIRQAVLAIRKFEPRPEEDLFRRGRAPPDGLLRRHWADPVATTTLWRAFDMLFVSAKQLSTQAALLLAEARRRWFAKDDIFPV